MSAHKVEDVLRKPKQPGRKPARNPYLVKYDGRMAVFRTPRWRTILGLFVSFLLCALAVAPVAMDMIRWGVLHAVPIVMGLFFLALATPIALSTGANEVAFDLSDRTYRRILLPPRALFGKMTRNLVGAGNPIGGRIIEGEMSEIEGVQIVEGRGKHSRLYSIQAIWADRKQPPCVLNFLENVDEARNQVLEIASLLQLPILEPSLLDDPIRLRSRWS